MRPSITLMRASAALIVIVARGASVAFGALATFVVLPAFLATAQPPVTAISSADSMRVNEALPAPQSSPAGQSSKRKALSPRVRSESANADQEKIARVLAAKKLSRESIAALPAPRAQPVPQSPVVAVPSSRTRATLPPLLPAAKPKLSFGNGPNPATPSSVVRITPETSANVWMNLTEPQSAFTVDMGDQPGRGSSLCSEGKQRRFGEIDSKTLAGLLPESNTIRARTVCARRGRFIADYAFK
jgi:hypothetical protein